ncbi:MAG: hypothetical protein ABI333_19230 [bacterium]
MRFHLIVPLALLVAGCGSSHGVGDAGQSDTGANVDAAATDGGVDTGADPDSGVDPDASGLPPGWVPPRCGTDLVDTCADCPGFPFVCESCDVAAHCVADCAADCAAAVTPCADNGTCVTAADECEPFLFCGCPPQAKECDQGPDAPPDCVASCELGCPGDPQNCQGRCGNPTDDQGCCPDPAGDQVYRCSGDDPLASDPALCHDACDGCGAGFCVHRNDDPNASYVECSELGCCPQSESLCPDTDACVPTCADCGSQWVGICAVGGRCVTDCDDCSRAQNPGVVLMPCDGFCTDIMSYQYHCGGCGTACAFPAETCSQGHCCGEDPATSMPTTWCPSCSCCTDSYYCSTNDCTHCVP